MKNDLPEEKKPQKQPGYETSETNQSPFEGFQKDDDDVDFEILDALEQMGRPEDISAKDRESEEDDTIELTLDDEDLIFDDEAEDEHDFHFDESLRVGLEEELLGEPASEFRLDAPLEEKGQEEGIQSTLEDNDFAFDLHQEDEMNESEFSFDDELDLGLGDSSSEDTLFEAEEQTFDLSLSDTDPFDEVGSEGASSEDTEAILNESDAETFSIEEGFADLAEDIETTEEQPIEDAAVASTDQEPAFNEFAEKPVIPVGEDQVIDLGDETDLDQASDLEEGVDSWSQAEETNILETEEQDSEDFMASFGDIDLDLEEEATNFLEDSLPEEPDDVIAQSPSTFDFEEGLDLTIDDDEEDFETPDIMADTASAEDIPDSQPAPAFEEDWDQEDFEDEEFPVELSEDMEAEEEDKPERDEREFLDLDLQLRDEQMEQFERMIAEAKTLHSYIETLDIHHNEINETIYQKLSEEYLARKTSIFRTSEFQTMRAEVEHDLQHMLAKRTEFVTAVDRLNEELEEIKVRHLVGEYTQATLAEKEETQQQDILLWNEKLEHIEQFIDRYQAALDAEQALNPLPQEHEVKEEEQLPSSQPSEPNETEETIIQEDEEEWMQETSEESLGDFFGEGEEAFTETEELPEEDLLESDFSMDSDFGDDVDLDQLSKVAEELDREQAESFGEEQVAEDEAPQEQVAMVSCKKCGRQTPASEKFCVHCGAKAQ